MQFKSDKYIKPILLIIIINSLVIFANILILIKYNEKYRQEYNKELINAYNIGYDDAIKTIDYKNSGETNTEENR